MSTKTRASKNKQTAPATKKNSSRQDPKGEAESGPREPGPISHTLQISASLKTLTDIASQQAEIIQALTSKLSSCVDAINNQNDSILKMEKHPSGFQEMFNTFQKHLESKIAEQLRLFEHNIQTTCCRCKCHSKSKTADTKATQDKASTDIANLTNILIKEKENDAVKESCKQIKRNIRITWGDLLHKRRKSYWNFIKNKQKSQLYSDWVKSAPDYLPLKFRPKKITGENHDCTKTRIKTAHYRYRDDIQLMMEYAKVHITRVKSIDSDFNALVKVHCRNNEELSAIKEMWESDTKEQEYLAAQLWTNKHEKFLNLKKHEDEIKQDTSTTHNTWSEILHSRITSTNKNSIQPRPSTHDNINARA